MRRNLFLLVAAFFFLQLTCFASINITKRSSTVKITPAGGGKFITIKSGTRMPAIANGSTIQIVNGGFTVATTASATANLSILGNTIAMALGNTVQVSINSKGAIRVYDSKGRDSITTFDGNKIILKAGQSVILAGQRIKEAEGYTPPTNDIQGIVTQVQTEESAKDISPVS